jgi:hypothetical protein
MPRQYTRNPNHGTRSMYSNQGCRCELCTRANADYQREYCKRPERKAYNQQLSREHYRAKRRQGMGA